MYKLLSASTVHSGVESDGTDGEVRDEDATALTGGAAAGGGVADGGARYEVDAIT